MKKTQKRLNSITKVILSNEVWLYGREITSFYKARKYAKKQGL